MLEEAAIRDIASVAEHAATDERAYRQCTRCVMDTSDPEIRFDQEGRCCHCSDFVIRKEKHAYRGRESDLALERLFDQIIRSSRGKDFDCVVGISGGADSSYVACLAKERGLRPLAVHLDNGWNTDKAVLNIRAVTDGLGVDYESFVLDWSEFRDLQLAFLRASVPEAETPTDMAIPAALHLVAERYRIKYILSGGNLVTEGILPKNWHYDVRDLRYFKYISTLR